MIYIFDIDGTICSNTSSDYSIAEPYYNRIEAINLLKRAGNKIIFFTARGMGRNNGNIDSAYQEFYHLTSAQLISWGVEFDQILMGKPQGDIFVDDKAITDIDFFNIEK